MLDIPARVVRYAWETGDGALGVGGGGSTDSPVGTRIGSAYLLESPSILLSGG